jgi:hypothetical protein
MSAVATYYILWVGGGCGAMVAGRGAAMQMAEAFVLKVDISTFL